MKEKIVSIQYLRALAALMVVFYHTFSLEIFCFPKISFAEYGKYGVNIFFVISGIIMAHILKFETNPIAFLKKRFKRIYPIYYEVYFLCMILWLIFRGIFKLPIFPHGSWLTNLTLLPFELTNNVGDMLLPVAWTLYYEIFFYLLIFISLIIFKNKIGIHLFFATIIASSFFTKEIFGLEIFLLLHFYFV